MNKELGSRVIKQKHSWDCAICAHAMYLDKTYDEIFTAYGNPTEGYPLNKSVEYLWDLGLDVDWIEGKMPEKKAVVVVKSKPIIRVILEARTLFMLVTSKALGAFTSRLLLILTRKLRCASSTRQKNQSQRPIS